MAKSFYNKQDTNEQLAGKTKTVFESTEMQTTTEAKQGKPQTIQKRNVGRPATKDIKNTCKHINVAIPKTLLNQWEEIKLVHGNNLTAYIIKLMKKDMEANYKQYKELTNSLKNI